MSSQSPSTAVQSAILACERLVYRAARSSGWLDKTSNRVLPAAFVRRAPLADEAGLSVNTSVEACGKGLSKIHGVISLHVGWVRNLGLDVISDPNDETHANIVGMPRSEEDADKADPDKTLI